MFQLDKAVDEWCNQIIEEGSAEALAELKDHLYCEVDNQLAQGLTPEQAFVAATEKLGDPSKLRAEWHKNRNLFSQALCRIRQLETNISARWIDHLSADEIAYRQILFSLIFALLVLLSSLLLGHTGYNEAIMFVLMCICFVPFSLLANAPQAESVTLKGEWAALKKILLFWRKSKDKKDYDH